jgi:hypothetical protein
MMSSACEEITKIRILNQSFDEILIYIAQLC